MNRRSFLTALAGASTALIVEPYLHKAFSFPTIIKPKLALSPEAFKIRWEGLDEPPGISLRFVREYDAHLKWHTRIDALYGFATISHRAILVDASGDILISEGDRWENLTDRHAEDFLEDYSDL